MSQPFDPVEIIQPLPFTGFPVGDSVIPPWVLQSAGGMLAALVSAALLLVIYRLHRPRLRRAALIACVLGYGLAILLALSTRILPQWAIDPTEARILTLNQMAHQVTTRTDWQLYIADLPVNEKDKPVWVRATTSSQPVQCLGSDIDDSTTTVTLTLDCSEKGKAAAAAAR